MQEFASDALAVMDATRIDRAAAVALSSGALWATLLAAGHPERVECVAYISPAVALAPGHPEREMRPFEEALDSDDGWAKYNVHYWRRVDCIGCGLQTTAETLADATLGLALLRDETFRETCAWLRCPVLVIAASASLVVVV